MRSDTGVASAMRSILELAAAAVTSSIVTIAITWPNPDFGTNLYLVGGVIVTFLFFAFVLSGARSTGSSGSDVVFVSAELSAEQAELMAQMRCLREEVAELRKPWWKRVRRAR